MTPVRLTAAWVAAQMGGTLAFGNASREFGDVSIDSRTLKTDDLFVAIRGERFNGALFAAAAIESGAAGVVVPRGWHRSAMASRLRSTSGPPSSGEARRSAEGAEAAAERAIVIEVFALVPENVSSPIHARSTMVGGFELTRRL